jgi:hypothetical protein
MLLMLLPSLSLLPAFQAALQALQAAALGPSCTARLRGRRPQRQLQVDKWWPLLLPVLLQQRVLGRAVGQQLHLKQLTTMTTTTGMMVMRAVLRVMTCPALVTVHQQQQHHQLWQHLLRLALRNSSSSTCRQETSAASVVSRLRH